MVLSQQLPKQRIQLPIYLLKSEKQLLHFPNLQNQASNYITNSSKVQYKSKKQQKAIIAQIVNIFLIMLHVSQLKDSDKKQYWFIQNHFIKYNSSCAMSLPIVVSKYELTEKLGEGAFALVYKGRNLQTSQTVAVKKMKKLTKQDVEMVKKEIEIMKDLKHKNIVLYKTDFRENGDWYIVLEYCGKGDMEQFKKKVGKIPEAHCKLFVRGILQALVELHKRKIAHRDLKLANILINDDYKLKLADFGFSKDYETGYMKSFCGTPLSMAPQILRRQNYNEKCDVWSLGVLTFMMLYNKPPFFPTKVEGMGIPGITNAVTLRNHKFDESVQVSASCKKFVDDCLQKEAKNRLSTKQLLDHEWFSDLFSSSNVSQLREIAFKGSIKEKENPLKQESTKLCEAMLFGVFEHHLKKMSQQMLLNVEIISKFKNSFVRYFASQQRIIDCYFLVVLKRLQQLSNRQVIYVLADSSFRIPLQQLKKFKEFQKEISNCVSKQIGKSISANSKVNIQKQIIKFCLNETELLMECMMDEQINEKLFILKTLCKFVTAQFQTSLVEIKWGDRKDMEKYVKYIYQYFKGLSEQGIIKVINEELDSDDDLESTWLIQNHIRESKANKSLESELGKLALYVLNIPTNFSADKLLQTQKIELDQESWQWMRSFA